MTTVAVTGASGAIGRALLERLDADRRVTALVGIDVDAPPMPVAKLDFRAVDVRDRLLHLALGDADVLVHLATGAPAGAGEDARFAVTVNGTRNVLDAAAKAGVGRVVVLSSAAVYGAHPGNPIPLTEDAPLRANPDFPPAYQRLLAEELVAAWAAEHPDVGVAVLRPAVVVSAETDDWVARHLESPRLPLVRGHAPPLQFAGVDDVAAAVHLAAVGDLPPGAYNVACEGWLAAAEVSALLGRKPVELPENVAFGLGQRLWRQRLVAAPPGFLHYVMHPWVVATDKLRAAGWEPTASNREVLREFAAAHHGWLSVGRVRVRRRDLYVGGFALVGLIAGLAIGSRRRPQ
jgi:UDP-glucose 4-epimerase